MCNLHGLGMAALQRLNKGVALASIVPGQVLRVPHGDAIYAQQGSGSSSGEGAAVGSGASTSVTGSGACSRAGSGASSREGSGASRAGSGAQAALIQATALGETPKDGLVAVKVGSVGRMSPWGKCEECGENVSMGEV